MASKLIFAALCFFAFAALVSARPRFIAIPLEDIEFIQGPSPFVSRVRRAAQAPRNEPEASASQYPGQQGSDYVDYGAYTGGNGAFGWYTDHPVLTGSYGKAY